MELAIISAKQVTELFILIFAGIILQRKKLITEDGKKLLSNLLINFIVPCMILNSYLGTYRKDTAQNLGNAFLYSILLCGIGIIISLIASIPVRREQRGIIRFAISFSNAAYMGFPLVRALFGEEGIIYASAYVTIFNLLLWTVGYLFLTDTASHAGLVGKILKCPAILSVIAGLALYFAQIPVADVLSHPIQMVGDMTTPLSMLITGVTIGETRIGELWRKKNIWFVILTRLMIVPSIGVLLFKLLHFQGMTAMVCLILEACPVAAITTMLAVQFRKKQEDAAGMVVLSTLLSIVTLPVYIYFIQLLIA